MARPLKPTFNPAEREELHRLTSDGPLEMTYMNNGEYERQSMRTSEPDHLQQLLNAEQLAVTHSHWRQAPNYQLSPIESRHSIRVVPSDELRKLVYAWQDLADVMETSTSSAKQLSPRLEHFFAAYKTFMLRYREELLQQREVFDPGLNINTLRHDIDKHLEEGFDYYQQAIRSHTFRRAIKQNQTNHNRNRRSLLNYVEVLLEAYPSLYVLHLDLGYNVFNDATMLKATYSRLREDLNALLHARHRNPMWKDDLVGHLWKIEDAPLRRFHAHLFLFYNGVTAEHHQQDVNRLQQRWIEEITHQEGALYARRKGQKSVWVPENRGYLITSNDVTQVHQLKEYLNYLVQIDKLFGLETLPQARVFGKGNAPNLPTIAPNE
ncbi:Protein of unknown function [Vreelandella subterranea]|uniref:YagK/YfjJ C-terminal domain-containing protein n=1 Tax=Vreelandella subterranea TaxID=416874 RepID=A0A1H9VR68_9GAMM|nr:inovirus-type Gp2 protein [Halomonas subterranea]SES24102.1 Protein of unknown function [Halomonas subterranea]